MKDRKNDMQAILQDDAQTLSFARRVFPAQDAYFAEIEVTDVPTGQVTLELMRLDDRGQPSVTFVLDADMDSSLRAALHYVLGDAAEAWALVAADRNAVLACGPDWDSGVAALNAHLPGPVQHLAVSDTRAVVLAGQDAPALMWFDKTGDRGVICLDISDLRLGGVRQVTGLALTEDGLWISVADPMAGFDLFHADLTDPGAAPQRVLARGAHRFAVNAAISAVRPATGTLLVGTAALSAPRQPLGSWGAELISVETSGRWDLIMGQPRFSPDGLKLPASASMPGFDDDSHSAIKAIASGPLGGEEQIVVAVQSFTGPPQDDRASTRCDLFQYAGRLRLFWTGDFESWIEIPHDLGTDIGAVTDLCLTEAGVLVGHEMLGRARRPVILVPML